MSDSNKHNLLYFESDSMRGLYDTMYNWQAESGKRLLSTNIQQDGNRFCCIAVTNPVEVVICCGYSHSQASVDNGRLLVR